MGVEAKKLDIKRIKITGKRQITIPRDFFDSVGMATEARCYLEGNRIILEPVSLEKDGDFSEELLAELIQKGLEGKELLETFIEMKQKVKENIDKMHTDGQRLANDPNRRKDMDDVFGED